MKYIDILVPVGFNESTQSYEARCDLCKTLIYSMSGYVHEAIGRPLPYSLPHTCVKTPLPPPPADYGNYRHYDDGTPVYTS